MKGIVIMREIRGPAAAAHREPGRCLRALPGGEGVSLDVTSRAG